jgi:hypothetical protein
LTFAELALDPHPVAKRTNADNVRIAAKTLLFLMVLNFTCL